MQPYFINNTWKTNPLFHNVLTKQWRIWDDIFKMEQNIECLNEDFAKKIQNYMKLNFFDTWTNMLHIQSNLCTITIPGTQK